MPSLLLLLHVLVVSASAEWNPKGGAGTTFFIFPAVAGDWEYTPDKVVVPPALLVTRPFMGRGTVGVLIGPDCGCGVT